MSSSADVFVDEEFGRIPYKRVANSRYVRIRLGTDGTLRASLPLFAPIKSIGKLVDSSRTELRRLVGNRVAHTYQDGQKIGHSHTLRFTPNRSHALKHVVKGQVVHISYPQELDQASPSVQEVVREGVAKALRTESKAYLPRRLAFLAQQGDFNYERVRFAHQSGRWGSCSSSGTISLNIALMALPLELIDYVLIHELSHTRQMNHSDAFWNIVGTYYPNYKAARKSLKLHSPYL